MLNKKALMFSIVSLIFVILFVSFTLVFSRHVSSSESSFVNYYSNYLGLDSIDSLDASLLKFHNVNYSGINSASDGFYLHYPLIQVQDSYDSSFSDFVNGSYLGNNFGTSLSSNADLLVTGPVNVDLSADNSIAIYPNVDREIVEVNLSLYVNYLDGDITLDTEPTSDGSGTEFNLNIYDSTDSLVDSFSKTLDYTDISGGVFKYSMSGESFEIYFEDYILQVNKSSSNVEINLTDLKYKLN